MYGEKRFVYANKARVLRAAKLMKAAAFEHTTSDDPKVTVAFHNNEDRRSFERWCEHSTAVYAYLTRGTSTIVDVSLSETKMTAEEFEAVTGARPEHDDLDRVNCAQAGAQGHQCCGTCPHGKPAFLHCPTCFEWRQDLDAWKIRVQDVEVQDERFFYINRRLGVHVPVCQKKEVLERLLADRVETEVIVKAMEALSKLEVGQIASYSAGYVVRIKDVAPARICSAAGPNHNCGLPFGHGGKHVSLGRAGVVAVEKPSVRRTPDDNHEGGCLGCNREAIEMVHRGWSPRQAVTVVQLGTLSVRVCDDCAKIVADGLITSLEQGAKRK